MGVFGSLKRAFGFGPSDYDDDMPECADARVTPLRERQDVSAQQSRDEVVTVPAGGDNPENVAMVVDSVGNVDDNTRKQMQLAIFDSVLSVFNEALPEFLQKTVDSQSQKEYLYAQLDASAKEYLERIENEAIARCNARWEQERRRLLTEMDSLKNMASKEVEDSSEAKKQQLSAERQKRALTEKVRELEKQLADISAENEQYMLENKSLVNKLRVTHVLGGDREGSDGGAAAKIADLAAGLELAQKELADRKEAAENEVRSLNDEISALKSALEQSRAKDDLGDAMLSDLNKRTAEAVEQAREQTSRAVMLGEENASLRQKLDEVEHERAETSHELENVRAQLESANVKIARITTEHQSLQIEHQEITDKLNECNESLRIVDEMSRQLDDLEKSRQSNEAFLRKQRDEIMQQSEQMKMLKLENKEYADAIRQKDDAIRRLEDVVDSLRKTIENNMYERTQSESALRSEIERLKGAGTVAEEDSKQYSRSGVDEDLTGEIDNGGTSFEVSIVDEGKAAIKKEPVKKRRKTQKKFKISAIDDTLEDTDWLISVPPVGKTDSKGDASGQEFGYKEPPRKHTPENPAQMSLW